MDALPARCQQQRRGSRHGNRPIETSSMGRGSEVLAPPRDYLERGGHGFGARPTVFHHRYGKSCVDPHTFEVAVNGTRRVQRRRAVGTAHRVVVQPPLAAQRRPRTAAQTAGRGGGFRLRHTGAGSARQQAGRCHGKGPAHLRRHTVYRRDSVRRRRAVLAEEQQVHEPEELPSQTDGVLGRKEPDDAGIRRLSTEARETRHRLP